MSLFKVEQITREITYLDAYDQMDAEKKWKEGEGRNPHEIKNEVAITKYNEASRTKV